MDTTSKQYEDASVATYDNLRTIALNHTVMELSSMTLPEIEEAVQLIAKVAPAGNVPGVIFNGLLRLPQRQVSAEDNKKNIRLLFRGVKQAFQDKAVFGAFFAGPAAIIWAYQSLLRLAGKDPEAAFPEGTWQFYADYALRDDTARHTCETHGFETTLLQHNLKLNQVDILTAWVMTAVYTLHQYDHLLTNEWRERVYTDLLAQLTADSPDATRYAKLYRTWEKQRPYGRERDSDQFDSYPIYRQKKFDQFLQSAMHDLPDKQKKEWQKQVEEAEQTALPAYVHQMTIRAYLEPDAYGETRLPLPLENVHVGLILNGRYHYLPICNPDSTDPIDFRLIRSQIATICQQPIENDTNSLIPLAEVRREFLPYLLAELPKPLQEQLDTLRAVPILINADQRSPNLPLAQARQAERGIGHHALTIFHTGRTHIFDQSHIFFDGTWGVALAEIMTNESLSWAHYLHTLESATLSQLRPYSPAFQISPDDLTRLAQAEKITPEVSVESANINLKGIIELRRAFKQRSDLLTLTVNDLLMLYRAIHAVTYKLDPKLDMRLQYLKQQPDLRLLTQLAYDGIQREQTNPAMLIPVDGSRRQPYQRVYPITIEIPLEELRVISLHRQAREALTAVKQNGWQPFDTLKTEYLAGLAAFGKVMTHAKQVAIEGKSSNVATIKLLANMPTYVQRLLDQIPAQFEVLNDIIKGREVFSNVGQVAPNSTLTRFITAKDNNDKKTMAWGILTDADKRMIITLRDFRPHVAAFKEVGQTQLAKEIAQDYLDTYADGLNQYVEELNRITRAKRRKKD